MLTAADHFRICRSSRILPNQKSLILNRALIVTAVEKKQILLFNRRANGAQRAKKPLARLARGCVSIFTIHFLSSVFRACPAAKARKAPSTKTAIYFRSPDRMRKVSATRMKRSLHCLSLSVRKQWHLVQAAAEESLHLHRLGGKKLF